MRRSWTGYAESRLRRSTRRDSQNNPPRLTKQSAEIRRDRLLLHHPLHVRRRLRHRELTAVLCALRLGAPLLRSDLCGALFCSSRRIVLFISADCFLNLGELFCESDSARPSSAVTCAAHCFVNLGELFC